MDIRAISTIPLFSKIRKRELAMFFGGKLKEFRHDFNLSRYALGYKTGFSEHTIRDYERVGNERGFLLLRPYGERRSVHFPLFILHSFSAKPRYPDACEKILYLYSLILQHPP